MGKLLDLLTIIALIITILYLITVNSETFREIMRSLITVF